MSEERLMSTGRTPALKPTEVATLLERYFGEDKPSMPALAEEFSRATKTGKHAGVLRPLSLATIRKYLKSAGVTLPRGRACDGPRVAPAAVRTLMNRIPTEVLIGEGRAKLLGRLLERGGKIIELSKEFGISKDRVSRFKKRATATVIPATEPTPAPEPAAEPEVNILDSLDADIAVEENSEA